MLRHPNISAVRGSLFWYSKSANYFSNNGIATSRFSRRATIHVLTCTMGIVTLLGMYSVYTHQQFDAYNNRADNYIAKLPRLKSHLIIWKWTM